MGIQASEQQAIDCDVAAIARISAVPSLLRVICEFTGMGFAAVARVTDESWTACAVLDTIGFGLKPGDQLDLHTTLCVESRAARAAVSFDHASQDAVYCDHHTPRLYNIESYISVPIVRKDGSYFGNLCAVDRKPTRVSDERTLTMFGLFAELIALQLASEERQQATEAALSTERETSILREQFIAVLGHDLRGPLSAVGMTGELLARRQAHPELVQMGMRIRSASRRMGRLIDDVLDFARGRMGSGMGIALADAPNLSRSLREVLAETRSAHPERDLQDRIDIDVPVVCDEGRVQQLLSNLVGNAVMHGASGEPVEVNARVEREVLVLEVANGGEPIETRNLVHLFEPYWRPPTSKPGRGLGLGLYICAQIVKAHGGTLGVTSSRQNGTVFAARLPIGARPPLPQARGSGTSSEAGMQAHF